MKRPILLLALLAFAAPMASAQDIPAAPDAPDAGTTGSGSGSAAASGPAAALQQALASTGCQPWQLGAIQRAAYSASIRAQTASRVSAGVLPSGSGARGDAAESGAHSETGTLIHNIFERDMEARQVSDQVGRIRNILATVSSNIRTLFQGTVQDTGVACAPASDHECRATGSNPRDAYVVGHGPLIHICPHFFEGTVQSGEMDRITQGISGAPLGTDPTSEENRVRTLTHESAHVAGIGTMSGECYAGPPFSCGIPAERATLCDSPDGAPSDSDRSHWADIWALFVTCMSGHGDRH